MKTRLYRNLLVFVGVAALLGSLSYLGKAAPLQQEPPSLFTDSDTAVVTSSNSDPTVIRSRLVDVDLSLLGGDGTNNADNAQSSPLITLNLFDDVSMVAVLDQTEPISTGGYSWVGHIQGIEYSQVIFVVMDGITMANIREPNGVYQIRPMGEGDHIVLEIDESAFPELADDAVPVDLPPGDPVSDQAAVLADDGSVIDVMVVYTADARNAAGGTSAMVAAINLAVVEANIAYANSGINFRNRLVHYEEVGYTETGNSSIDLERLGNPSDGYVDNVHTLRNIYAADIVSFWLNNTGCGRGYLMSTVSPSFAGFAFNVASLSCATGNLTFAHEMGHNMSARHDWYMDPSTGYPYTYNHGYANFSGSWWRTVMAYNTHCSDREGYCPRLTYWSNPNVNNNGYPTGVAPGTSTACTSGNINNPLCDADNRLTLNNVAYTVANFRTSNDQVIINEVDTGSADAIELYNSGNNPVNLGQWHLRAYASGGSVDVDYAFSPTVTIQPHGYLMVHETSGTDTATDIYLGQNISWLDPGASGAVELKYGGQGADFVRFGNSTVTPPAGTGWTGTNPVGHPISQTLGRATYADTDNGDDWCSQTSTLGSSNLGCKISDDIVINEVDIGHPDAVEIYNSGDQIVDLSEWHLIAYFDTGSVDEDYIIPNNFSLGPNAYVVVDEDSGINTTTKLYIDSNILWDPTRLGGAVGLTDGSQGIDFMRWGNSGVVPPAGTSWFGYEPNVPPSGSTLGRNPVSTDLDDGNDWCGEIETLGRQNLGCSQYVYLPLILDN